MAEKQKDDAVLELARTVEALLFVGGEPMKISRLTKVTGAKKSEITKALDTLDQRLSESGSGLFLIQKDGAVQLTTHPDVSTAVQTLQEDEMHTSLTKAAREVLAIIAYRGPIGRAGIEEIRGVNCSHTIRTLLLRGLITREDNPTDNREYIYEISFEFLKNLGIGSVEDLPDFESLSEDKRLTQVLGAAPEDA